MNCELQRHLNIFVSEKITVNSCLLSRRLPGFFFKKSLFSHKHESEWAKSLFIPSYLKSYRYRNWEHFANIIEVKVLLVHILKIFFPKLMSLLQTTSVQKNNKNKIVFNRHCLKILKNWNYSLKIKLFL